MNLRFFLKIMTVVTVTFIATTAIASPYEMYGAGVQNAAMGTSLTYGEDYGATYHNAALLPEVGSSFSFGALITYSKGGIKLKDRPKGYDIPDGSSLTPLPSKKEIHPRGNSPGPQPIYAITVGATHNLGIKNFALGVAIFVPLNSMFRMSTHFPDERERFFRNHLSWELIDQRVARLDVELGVGYRILDWLSLGLTASFLPGAQAIMETYVPNPTDQTHILLSSDVTPTSAWAIGGGLLFQLPHNIRLAFSGRTSLSFDIEGNNKLQIRGVSEKGDIVQPLKWRPLYSPPSVSLGLSWKSPDNVSVEISGRYTHWEDYLDTVYEKTNFHDTFEGNLGINYQLSPITSFMFGIGFIPTPVPDQTGRTNYVDNSRFRFSLGGTHKISLFQLPFEIAWATQFHILIPHETSKKIADTYPDCSEKQTKLLCDETPDNLLDPSTGTPVKDSKGLQTGNPGFPGWTSGGFIAGLQLEIHL